MGPILTCAPSKLWASSRWSLTVMPLRTFPGLFTSGKPTLHPGQLEARAHLMLPSLLGALGTQPPARGGPSHRICLSVSS